MSLHKAFKTNNDAERQGRWFDIEAARNKDGTVPGFKMARMHKNNPEYTAAIEAIAKDLRQAIDLDLMSEEVASPVMRGVFVKVVLLDWRNIQPEDNGKNIPYSKEAADALMTELGDLYLLLADEARKIGNFRDTELEAVAKKSRQPSEKPSGNDAP